MNRGGRFFTLLFSTSLVSLVAFAQGCSSSSSGAGSGCANYVAALRDSAKECGRFNVSPSRESEYLARYQRSCDAVLAAPGTGVTPAVLDQCAAALRAQCGDDDACEELIESVRGTLADGTPCDDDTQCASGECKKDFTSQSSGPRCGTCAPEVKIGEPCPNGGCVVGAVCASSPGTSSESVCVALRTANEGESCGSASGTEAVRCAKGLYCRYETTSAGAPNGTCERPLAEGSACGEADGQYARCAPPFTCVSGRCGRLLGSGQACTDSSDCASGLGCDPSANTCAAIVWGANGAVCDDNLRRCDRGFCARTTGSSGTSETGTCVDYIADGQPCDETKSNEQRCDIGADCRDGTCQFEDPSVCK